MTTTRKLWLGFGALMALLVLSVGAIFVRLQSIEGNVREQSDVAQQRSAVVRELEINLLSYALATRAHFQVGDPKFRLEADAAAADVEQHLADYKRLAKTNRQRELASRFAAQWRELRDFGNALLDANDRSFKLEDSQRLADLRIGLENFLDDEMQIEAVQSFDARREATLRDIQTIARFILILLGVSLVIAALTSITVGRGIVRAEQLVQENREWLRVTLASIGDAVLATDLAGRITFLNPVAAQLTGWTQAEAVGQPAAGVFHIINEATRATVDDPIAKVLREGVIVGLANHTLLLTRDGREVPIDDSGAPIRNKAGHIVGAVLVFRDISERIHAQNALRESEESYRILAETASDTIIRIDQNSVIQFVNHAAERIFGYAPAEIIGQPLATLMPDEMRQQHHAGLARYLATDQRNLNWARVEVPARHKDGRLVPLEISFSEYRSAGSRFFIGVARDISERKQAEVERERLFAQEQESRATAEAATRAKDEFLAVVSHELRNPLNAILGYARLLRSMPPQAIDVVQINKTVDIIERSGKAQLELINDLLDTARVISGKLILEVAPVELPLIIIDAIEVMRPAANAKNIVLQQQFDPAVGQIVGDQQRLQQVILNLVNNAVKFTPHGGLVHVSLRRAGAEIAIQVRDNGKGIAPDFLPHLFGRFTQADASGTRRHGGLGLGLALVKQLVELHGGEITAESEGEGKGAAFTITLPVQVAFTAAQELKRSSALSEADSQMLAGVSALVIDDEYEARELVTKLLTDFGAEVTAVASAAECFALLADDTKAQQFNMLISDIGMPGEDGYSLMRRIREWERSREQRLPAIALTSFTRTEDRMAVMMAGFQMHVSKPVKAEELVAVINSLLGRFNQGSQ